MKDQILSIMQEKCANGKQSGKKSYVSEKVSEGFTCMSKEKLFWLKEQIKRLTKKDHSEGEYLCR